ncbi:tetratricopeptide repeat-containing diguanylate cyclase [Deinococcus psychrotolerans]|uniref:tetratricopeptide repeat-containing diguanylate cyclase n=1 Tax=Deinococcus psychrotolerans TaxID=2489213 RepID=UPI0013DE5832|nr:tetratricopeptide repeat-containing diguanylate cyclase [Deinococcus psychrotolerans]
MAEAWACRRSDSKRTVDLARAARQVIEELADLAQAALCLGYGLMRLGEYASALGEVQQALELFGELGDQDGQRKSLNVLGILQCEGGDLIASLKTFIQTRQLSAALGNVQGEIEALNNIGIVYNSMGDSTNTLECYLTTLPLSQQHGLRDVECQTLINLSVAYHDLGRYSEALAAAQSSLEVEAGSEPTLRALALHNAGRAHFGMQAYSLAQTCHQEALAMFTAVGDQAACAEVYVELGRVAQQQLDLTGAQALYEHSLALRQKVGEVRGQAESWLRLGELLGRLRQTDAALNALHEARTFAAQSQARTELCAADLALCQMYRQAGQHREALHHLEQHLQTKEVLFNDASDQRLQRLRLEFDVEQAGHERDLAERLSADLQQLNLELERTNNKLEAAHQQTSLLLAQVEHQANEDALTGLANRRAFDAATERLQNDLLARYGGEEFVILMQGADAATTQAVCERLRRSIEDYPWAAVRTGLRVTLSLGAATAHLDGSPEGLIQAADEALYEAKHAGRNRIRLHSPGNTERRLYRQSIKNKDLG